MGSRRINLKTVYSFLTLTMLRLKVLFVVSAAICAVDSMFILDDGREYEYLNQMRLENELPLREIRVRRSAQGPPPPLPAAKAQLGGRIRKQQPIFDDEEVYRAPTFAEDRADLPIAGSSYSPKHPKGKVGPVYTFVKTDYDANFKWGVRHVAGQKYAGRR